MTQNQLYNGKRFLVTGGAGFIGSHVIDTLLVRGAEVLCVDSFDSFYDPELKWLNARRHLTFPSYTLAEQDIRHSSSLTRLFCEFRPDKVIHLAARAGVHDSFSEAAFYSEVNVQGTANVLAACRKAAVLRVVNASSSSVYGLQSVLPLREAITRPVPASPYGQTKLCAEKLCGEFAKEPKVSVASLRFFTVYGPRQRPDMAISRFVRCLRTGQALSIYGNGRSSRDYTNVADITRGILAATDAHFHGHAIINLGTAKSTDLNALVAILARHTKATPLVRYQSQRAGDVERTLADNTRAEQLLGYTPKLCLDAGIKHYVRSLAPNAGLSQPHAQQRPESMPPAEITPWPSFTTA